ncbi:MAG TPA: HAD family hydrolase [Candidatus Binataceae bacterium]|nr:HAD family hydrolase [Candidatus Binataceae bacterium]
MASDVVVYLFDVDNTLLDNDRVAADLMKHLELSIGAERKQEYWKYFEGLRSELGYADYLGALQRYRIQYPRDFHIVAVSYFLVNYHFANRLMPGSLDVLEKFRRTALVAILSDGDVVFQPHKVERSGLREAVDGNVLIYIHKEKEFDDVENRYPADHYILVDDKIRILDAAKKFWGKRVTTVFPRQGHYALDPDEVGKYPTPDVTIDRIDQMLGLEQNELVAAARD